MGEESDGQPQARTLREADGRQRRPSPRDGREGPTEGRIPHGGKGCFELIHLIAYALGILESVLPFMAEASQHHRLR